MRRREQEWAHVGEPFDDSRLPATVDGMSNGEHPPMTRAFAEAWTSSRVLGEAGPAAYARGASYQRDRRVELVELKSNRVRALVRGTIPYSVTVGLSGRDASWSCTCPVGEDGSMCKHVVAVTLAVTAADDDDIDPPAVALRGGDDESDLGRFVAGLDHAELVALVVAQADTDWRLGERLRARAAAASNAPLDERAWRSRIEEAFAPYDDFVDYREAAGWADEVGEMLEAVGELVDTHPAHAVTLLEYAYGQANASMQWIDDSDGYLTSISSDIAEMHLAACEAAPTDPVALAKRLVDLELTSELDGFHRAAVTYAGVLGVGGLAEYRRLVEPAWNKLDNGEGESGSRGYSIREAMIGVALASGDPDELIRVRGRSLRTPDDYLEIVRVLIEADRPHEAIEWAQRGLSATVERTWQTPPLREALAGLLRDRGDAIGSVILFDDEYRRSPSLSAYRRLLEEADVLGERETIRPSAIDHLRRAVAAQPTASRGRSSDVLIEILMFDGEIDDAWVVAGEHGCVDGHWLSLAAARQNDHPLDAIPIYRRTALAAIDAKNNRGYATAVDYLGRIRQLAQRAEDPALFVGLIAEIRRNHKPKRNLMALLDRNRW